MNQKKSETQITVAAVGLGKDPSQATQTECLVTQIVLSLPHASRRVDTLIDYGAYQNFLSQKLARPADRTDRWRGACPPHA